MSDNEDEKPVIATTAGAELRGYVERIERLEEEKKTISDDIKDVYGELKNAGFDAKIVKLIVKIRKQDSDERQEQEDLLDTYKTALGIV